MRQTPSVPLISSNIAHSSTPLNQTQNLSTNSTLMPSASSNLNNRINNNSNTNINLQQQQLSQLNMHNISLLQNSHHLQQQQQQSPQLHPHHLLHHQQQQQLQHGHQQSQSQQQQLHNRPDLHIKIPSNRNIPVRLNFKTTNL